MTYMMPTHIQIAKRSKGATWTLHNIENLLKDRLMSEEYFAFYDNIKQLEDSFIS